MMRLLSRGTVEVSVPASPEAVWAVLSDVTRTGEWSHEVNEVSWVGKGGAVAGHQFVGHNQTGSSRWSRVCTINVADPGRVLEFTTWGGVPKDSTRWRFELTPTASGTRITQSFEVLKLARIWEIVIYLVVPAHRDRTGALSDDLQRLGDVAASLPGAADAGSHQGAADRTD